MFITLVFFALYASLRWIIKPRFPQTFASPSLFIRLLFVLWFGSIFWDAYQVLKLVPYASSTFIDALIRQESPDVFREPYDWASAVVYSVFGLTLRYDIGMRILGLFSDWHEDLVPKNHQWSLDGEIIWGVSIVTYSTNDLFAFSSLKICHMVIISLILIDRLIFPDLAWNKPVLQVFQEIEKVVYFARRVAQVYYWPFHTPLTLWVPGFLASFAAIIFDIARETILAQEDLAVHHYGMYHSPMSEEETQQSPQEEQEQETQESSSNVRARRSARLRKQSSKKSDTTPSKAKPTSTRTSPIRGHQILSDLYNPSQAFSRTLAKYVVTKAATTSTSSGGVPPESSSSRRKREDRCVMCQTRPRDIVLLPCRHLCLCDSCRTDLENNETLLCPVCEGEIQGSLQVFWY
jgi:hypothetical protein